MKKKAMTKEEIQGRVSQAVIVAREANRDAVQTDRLKAQRYFDGKVDIGHEEGRSKVVSTKCRDVVRQVKPSLLRVFLATDKPVEFIPRGNEDVALAEQATSYINWKFQQQGGYDILSDVFHDALVKKVGIAKVYWQEAEEAEIVELTGLNELEYIALTAGDDVEIVEHSEEEGMHDVKLSITKEKGDLVVESIAPEDFFIDEDATSVEDFTVCGHETEMPIADLVAMGIPEKEVEDLQGEDEDEEDLERKRDVDNDIPTDPMMRRVKVTEAYMRMDCEGTGKPLLYCFLLGGQKNKLLRKDVVKDTPFAAFEIDPEPHTFYGRSLVDLLMEDQDASTQLLRGVIDNANLTNNPGLWVDAERVNMDDVLNNEIGAVRRVKGAPQQSVMPDTIPFVAGHVIPFLQYYDGTIEGKTGVSRASLGLDPEALQNASATAVNATVNGGNAQAEVMARNLAEGVKRLFKLMLNITVTQQPREAMMRLNGSYVQVQPDAWDPTMDMEVNVGLGNGGEETKMLSLNQTLQTQMGIWQGFGPGNGMVTMTNIRNTLADMLALGGIKNADRYWQPMDPQKEQQLIAQAQQAASQQQGSDPSAAFLQAEQMKAQQRMQEAQMKGQIDVEKTKLNAEIKAREAAQKDDLERDKMLQDGVLRAADIYGKYSTQVNMAEIQRQQAATGPDQQ